MIKYLFSKLLLFSFFVSITAISQTPKPSFGTIVHIEKFSSTYVAAHNVDIWLPQNYSAKNKYAVLYINDGQELFDSTLDNGKQKWDVDGTLNKLMNEGKIINCVVVAIWNLGSLRHAEYFPQKPFESFTKQAQDSMYKLTLFKDLYFAEKVQSDNYLQFLVKELKPFVDKNYSTKKDFKNTFIMGASMGGLISMYAVCEYPNVFGSAACLSTYWPGLNPDKADKIPRAFKTYLVGNIPSFKNHSFYFDYGTIEYDYYIKPRQPAVDSIFGAKGYTAENYQSLEFKGVGHSIADKRKRLAIPMFFLLKK